MSEFIQADGDTQPDGFPARLRQAIATFGSVTALAKAIERSEGAVRKWLRGDSEPNVSDLRAIGRETGANIDWLVTGRGASGLLVGAVREDYGAYQVQPAQMNYTLLERTIASMEDELRAAGVELTTTKRSAMVVILYSLFHDAQAIDREAVTRVVKLAA